MKKWWAIVTAFITIVAVPLARIIWKDPTGMTPTSAQLPFFILLSIIEAFSLGLAVSFLIFGKKIVDKVVGKSKKLVWAVYLSTAWVLGNWWVHDNLHKVNGMNLQGLLYIEYTFHVTLIIAGVILVYAFFHPFLASKQK